MYTDKSCQKRRESRNGTYIHKRRIKLELNEGECYRAIAVMFKQVVKWEQGCLSNTF